MSTSRVIVSLQGSGLFTSIGITFAGFVSDGSGFSVTPTSTTLNSGSSVTFTETSPNTSTAANLSFFLTLDFGLGITFTQQVTPNTSYTITQSPTNVKISFVAIPGTSGSTASSSTASGNNISIINTIKIDEERCQKCDRKRNGKHRCHCDKR